MYWAHTMGLLTGEVGLTARDVAMTVVPMFHVSGWGDRSRRLAAGAKQVLPGPNPQPEDLAELIETEGVTQSSGRSDGLARAAPVRRGGRSHALSLEYVLSGGSATPKGLIEAYRERLGIELVSGYGMTETTPITHIAETIPSNIDATGDERTAIRAIRRAPASGRPAESR